MAKMSRRDQRAVHLGSSRSHQPPSLLLSISACGGGTRSLPIGCSKAQCTSVITVPKSRTNYFKIRSRSTSSPGTSPAGKRKVGGCESSHAMTSMRLLGISDGKFCNKINSKQVLTLRGRASRQEIWVHEMFKSGALKWSACLDGGLVSGLVRIDIYEYFLSACLPNPRRRTIIIFFFPPRYLQSFGGGSS